MGTVRLIAKSAYAYAGTPLVAGDLFDASERDAQILKVTGKAYDAPRLRKTPYARKDVTAESPEQESVEPKRQYRRRDLVPEP